MSVARHHLEWQKLVETSGPFLSMSELLRVFPQGLEEIDSVRRRALRADYDDWREAALGKTIDRALHRTFVLRFLEGALDLGGSDLVTGQALPASVHVRVPEHQESLSPDLALLQPKDRPNAGVPRLLVHVLDPTQALGRPLAGRSWKASPLTRMMTLLHGAAAQSGGTPRLGLVTNGHAFGLVYAVAGAPTSFVTFDTGLFFEEPLTLRAFASLLRVGRFLGVDEGDTLEALFERSAGDQQEITDQLGYQVRRAVEVLVQTIDRVNRDRKGELLTGISEARLYEAAVTVMMRMVFLLAAEEQGLLLLGNEDYDQFYAVATLRDQLQEIADRHGEDVLERRYDAFCRLLATFRAVHGGIEHEDLRLPAYGGSLFDPDRFPFLEGRLPGSSWRDPSTRATSPLAIDNRTVLHLLRALEVLEVRLPGGGSETRTLSFRALGVEQIGHVYEGLLDHTARRATTPVLSLKGAGRIEPEVAVQDLETYRKQGEPALLRFLKEQTGRNDKALSKALTYAIPADEAQRWLMVCENDPSLYQRVSPWAGLVRRDTHDNPVVLDAGAVYVTDGEDRRSTGTHYTPRLLTEPIVQYTLEPLVYEGPAEGRPRERWTLRTPDEILALRVCDLAMGSGAFLVQTCRYLGERLCEAWDAAEKTSPDAVLRIPGAERSEGDAAELLLPVDPHERLVVARRMVADRCLYGVDKNPMAVEMAKLSLWLETLQKNRPFTFLDHALRCGDSLLGLTDMAQLKGFHLDPKRVASLPIGFGDVQGVLADAVRLRRELESFSVNTADDAARKAHLLAEATTRTEEARLLADAIVAAALKTAGKSEEALDNELTGVATSLSALQGTSGAARLAILHAAIADEARFVSATPPGPRRPFHWVLEFPEVMAEGQKGFDAFVVNPPFMGGQKITGELGTDLRNYLVAHIAEGRRGSADLCAYFLLRVASLLRPGGTFGMLATNTIAQGDTREVALDALLGHGFSLPRAVPSRPWPGEANLEVALLWGMNAPWGGPFVLAEQTVTGITAQLERPGTVTGIPHRLAANADKSFQGSIVLGMGFVLTPEGAQALIQRDHKNKDALFPYLNGEDLNSHADQAATRWVINFQDWPLDRPSAPASYQGPVASDFPDCLQIVRDKVKPERDKNKRPARRLRWWQYAERSPALYQAIAGTDRVLVVAQTSRTQVPILVPSTAVFDQKLVIFATSSHGQEALQSSSFHYWWVIAHGSTLRTDAVYTPSDCFETFPFPENMAPLEAPGEAYHNHRRQVMLTTQKGLTKTYNRFHSPGERGPDIDKLRELHVAMDRAVASVYGWNFPLGHGFHETKQGVRYTLSEAARREVLDRLLALNHQRHAEEVAAGLHDKKTSRAKGARGLADKGVQQNDTESAQLALGELGGDQAIDSEVPAPLGPGKGRASTTKGRGKKTPAG